MLAVEKPQDNVKQAFSGGQNGRFIPAPKILYNLFRKDDRPREDKSWLDRITDALIDKLELRWEDDEEARMQARFPYHFFLGSFWPEQSGDLRLRIMQGHTEHLWCPAEHTS